MIKSSTPTLEVDFHTCPTILIATPASGQGKTTVASAQAQLHARQGRKVRVFKCGPGLPWAGVLANRVASDRHPGC